jgi:hypothetical protein
LKPTLWPKIGKTLAVFWTKTTIFRQIFLRKYFKNHNIGPGCKCLYVQTLQNALGKFWFCFLNQYQSLNFENSELEINKGIPIKFKSCEFWIRYIF